jgi:tRNA(adenine34) deaminase
MPTALNADVGRRKVVLTKKPVRFHPPPSALSLPISAVDDERFMGEALKEARKALAQREFPVGCVLVYRNRVIARGRRKGTSDGNGNELDHAEMVALRRLAMKGLATEAAAVTAFCTMEPCLMCYGALMLHGIGAIVYAYEDAMGGGTACPRERLSPLYRDSRIIVRGGVRRKESLALFKAFFSDRANRYWNASRLAEYTLKQ